MLNLHGLLSFCCWWLDNVTQTNATWGPIAEPLQKNVYCYARLHDMLGAEIASEIDRSQMECHTWMRE